MIERLSIPELQSEKAGRPSRVSQLGDGGGSVLSQRRSIYNDDGTHQDIISKLNYLDQNPNARVKWLEPIVNSKGRRSKVDENWLGLRLRVGRYRVIVFKNEETDEFIVADIILKEDDSRETEAFIAARKKLDRYLEDGGIHH